MPDKNDPRYRAKYERRYNAGRRFAEKSGICYLARQIQLLANKHRMLFIIIVFGFVLSCSFSTPTALQGVTEQEQVKPWPRSE